MRDHAFGRAEIGREHRAIGVDHADQCDTGKIVALGEHLRADQHIDFTGGGSGENFLRRSATARGIAIDARDACIGQCGLQRGFDALRAVAGRYQLIAAAGEARGRDARLKSAVVALQACFLLMQYQARAAMCASRDPTALRTHQRRRIAAAIDK